MAPAACEEYQKILPVQFELYKDYKNCTEFYKFYKDFTFQIEFFFHKTSYESPHA